MSFKVGHICRLCLKVTKDEYKEVNGLMRQMLDVILLQLDLDITRNPIVCRDCVEAAKKCLIFKSICLDTEKNIVLFSMGREKMKHSIEVICRQRENVEVVNDTDLVVCRFCLTQLERNTFVSFNSPTNETLFQTLALYMPEMDFNIISDSVVCTTCKEKLEDYCRFALKCLDTEEKIKEYCRIVGTCNSVTLELEKVRLFFKNILEYPQICTIKEEPKISEDTEYVFYCHREFSALIKLEEDMKIKEEITFEKDPFKSVSEVRLDKYGDTFPPKEYDKGTKSGFISLNTTESHTESFSQKPSSDLESHVSVHKDVSNLKMFKCSSCAYETKRERNLKRHMSIHKDVSEIEMYACTLCAHKAKQKAYLKKHMLTHKDVNDINMYRCTVCAYQGKQKSYLDKHMFTHKDVTEIKMYKCSLCPYEAKRKIYLTRHMLTHKDVNEIKMYECSLCTYKAKEKRTLNVHMLVHKSVSEVKTYKCSLCPYEAKQNSNLRIHMFVHKDASEIEMHKCPLCAYEAKQKKYLTKHILTHKARPNIIRYKCTGCGFETEQRCDIKTHMLDHRDLESAKVVSVCLPE